MVVIMLASVRNQMLFDIRKSFSDDVAKEFIEDDVSARVDISNAEMDSLLKQIASNIANELEEGYADTGFDVSCHTTLFKDGVPNDRELKFHCEYDESDDEYKLVCYQFDSQSPIEMCIPKKLVW